MKIKLIISILFLTFASFAQKPIMLDNIHYSVVDSTAQENAALFFKTFFRAKPTFETSDNPLTFMDFLAFPTQETSISISYTNCFEKKTIKKENIVTASTSILATYGVHWLAINTKNIKKTLKSLLKQGYSFVFEDFSLPNEPEINAVAIYGFENNIIVLVERPQLKTKAYYGIDHVQLIVKNLEENVKFYQDVLGAELMDKRDRSIVLKIGSQKIVLSEPEALGLVREQVWARDTNNQVSHIDCLGFLYDEIEPAYYAAKANFYPIIKEPQVLYFNKKPTPYTICKVLSPDHLEIDLIQEEGRTYGRTYVKSK